MKRIPLKKYDEIHTEIRSGDILLCSGTAVFSRLIQQATGSPWSHVGFILYVELIDRLVVLESVENRGVRAFPLRSYINNYNGAGEPYPGKILIARHAQLKNQDISKLSTHGFDLIGYPYDNDEILKIAGRICLGTEIDDREAGKANSYICSEYAYECYNSIGIEIEHGKHDFVTPADFFNDPNVSPIAYVDI